MGATVSLVVTAGPMRGRRFEFATHDTFLFGRGLECHARLAETDASVSRFHFLLEVNPPAARLRDLGSLNGTRVNGVRHGGRGEPPTDVDLRDGDEIRVGATLMRVEIAAVCARCHRRITPPDPGATLCQTCGGGGSLSVLLTSPEHSAEEPAAIGESIGPYRVERLLGKGGMGAVYLARRAEASQPLPPAASSPAAEDARRGEAVALKVMLPGLLMDEAAREGFLREIEVTRSLRHPNIVALLDLGRQQERFYFALEYCDGGSAETLRRISGGVLPLATVIRIASDALEGLSFAHESGFVHRDLKPDNVLLAGDGTARLADFGLAKNFQQSGLSGMTTTGVVAGTLFFMPREQLTSYRQVRPVSDVWSLAATLYHLLTGEYPRDFASNADPLAVVLKGGVIPLRERDPSVPAPFAEVLGRALEDDPVRRYPTGREFAAALRDVL